jgi:hypothetical protein
MDMDGINRNPDFLVFTNGYMLYFVLYGAQLRQDSLGVGAGVGAPPTNGRGYAWR